MPIFITDYINTLLIIGGLILFGLFIYATFVFYFENERMAARKSFYLAFFLASPYFLMAYYDFSDKELIALILVAIPLFVTIILLLPFNGVSHLKTDLPKGKIDERDIMFSRRLLKNNKDRFEDYYQRHPEHLESDEAFRKLPGLLSKGSFSYDPVMFAASDASFFTVDQLKNAVDGIVHPEKHIASADKMTLFLKNWSKKLGALDVGVTILKDYHKYSHIGRGDDYGKEVDLNHQFAIAFTVEMDSGFVANGPQAPIVMESAQQYLSAAAIAVQLAQFIRQLGFPARAHIDGNYRVVCPLVAKDAGLGEIGRMGLLMTPKQGPRVRIAVVTTDIPLLPDMLEEDKSMIDFCELCKKCAKVCPSKSISESSREMINGVNHWQINSDSCFQFWCKCGTDCGRCMASCPYSHPNNLLHNFVRFGIRHNFMFRKLALLLDDYFYGKQPKAKPIAEWMNVK